MEEDYIPEGTPKATFWYQATPMTTHMRCTIPAKGIGGQSLGLSPKDLVPKIDIFGQHTDEAAFPRQKGPAVWQFPGNRSRDVLMREMIRQEIPTFIETDDNYVIPSLGQPGMVNAWKEKYDPEKPEEACREIHRALANIVDGIIVSTPYLAEYYSRHNPNVWVCPNSVDPDDWVTPVKPKDGKLRIGYAYSSSHWYDLELVMEGLEWASKQENVEVVLMGPLLQHAFFKRFKYVHFPWTQSLQEYRENLQILDVGLCPIRSGRWADSRSDLKALEYTMVGAVPVMSATESYKPWFDQEALFCDSRNRTKDWTRIIKEIVNNRDEVPRLLTKAKEYVNNYRLIAHTAHLWEEALELEGSDSFAQMGSGSTF